MPDANRLIWVSGSLLLKERRFLEAFDLAMAILHDGLQAFDPVSCQFVSPSLHISSLLKDGSAAKDFIENLQFRESDVLEFESKHFRDSNDVPVDRRPDDQEIVYKKTLEKIIDSTSYIGCENCTAKLLAKKGLIDLKRTRRSGGDRRELGRLRTEKQNWELSIDAAVKSVLNFTRKVDERFTHAELEAFIYKEVSKAVTITSIEKIWKAFPDKFKKGAGRPKKNKKPPKYPN